MSANRSRAAFTPIPVVEWRLDQAAADFLAASFARHPELPDSIFTSPEWLDSAQRWLLGDRRLLVATVTTSGKDYSLLAFTLGSEVCGGLPVRTLRLLGYPYGDRHPIGRENPEPVAALLCEALRTLPVSCDALILDEVPDRDRPMSDSIAHQVGFKARWRVAARTPYFDLAGFTLPEDRFARYPKSLITRIRRARKKLTEAHEFTIEVSRPEPVEIPALVTLMAEIEGRSWKGHDGVGIFSRPDSHAFFSDLSQRLATRRAIQIAVLNIAGAPVAYRFGFVSDRVIYDYNFAHLPEYSALAPGRILLDETIAFAIGQHDRGVDASRGSLEKPHLLADWTDDTITHGTVWLCPATLRGRVTYYLAVFGPRLRAMAGKAGRRRPASAATD